MLRTRLHSSLSQSGHSPLWLPTRPVCQAAQSSIDWLHDAGVRCPSHRGDGSGHAPCFRLPPSAPSAQIAAELAAILSRRARLCSCQCERGMNTNDPCLNSAVNSGAKKMMWHGAMRRGTQLKTVHS